MPRLSEFISKVEELASLGVEYAHAGRSRNGVDCAGIVALPLLELRVPFRDVQAYTREAYEGSLLDAFAAQMVQVPRGERQPGDVLLLWFGKKSREPQHVAVLVDSESIVHAHERVGRVVRVHLDLRTRRRIKHVMRFPRSMLE